MDLNKIVEEITEEEQKLEEPKTPPISQEQITQSIEQILFQRMNQSEVELMKAENLQLKQTLKNFTDNYMEFEDLTKSLIQRNSESVENNLNMINRLLTQKLENLQNSNELLNQNLKDTFKSYEDNYKAITNRAGQRLQESVDRATVELEKRGSSLEKKINTFWSFNKLQMYLFWSAMLSLILLTIKPTFETFGIIVLPIIFKIVYPIAILPITVLLIITVVLLILLKFNTKFFGKE